MGIGMRTFAPARRPAVKWSLLAAAVIALGGVDLATGPDVSMAFLYLVPVAAAAWLLGAVPGAVLGLVAALSWAVADAYVRGWDAVALWNASTRFAVFVAVAYLVARLHRERTQLRTLVGDLTGERARLETMLGSISDPIVVVDDDGRVSTVNDPAKAVFGPDGLVGKALEDVIPSLAAVRAERGRSSTTLCDQRGRDLQFEVSRVALARDRRSAAAVYVLRDITPYLELDRMREQLLYSVAHELRGPLGGVENALDILATEYADMPVEDFARVSLSGLRTVRRLRRLMEDLLSAGSIEAGRLSIQPEVVGLREIVAEASEMSDLLLAERGQRLDLDIGDDCVVRADPRYARQVLSNLLTNASKYAPAGTPITVRGERRDGEVYVTVADRGPGIPEAELSGLFERFYRAKGTGGGPGIGLGLAIAKGIVEMHGGRIGVDSQVGRGTTVWLTLPSAGQTVGA